MPVTCRLLAFAVLASAAPLHAQSVQGHVLDPATQRPVPTVVVTAMTRTGDVVGRTRTDSAGRFVLPLGRSGEYRLNAKRIGYREVTSPGFDVSAYEALEVDLHLSATAVELEPLTIRSRAEPPRLRHLQEAGFYERERSYPGLFMRREDVQRTRGNRMSDVLATLPGSRRAVIGGRSAVSIGRSGGMGRACPPAVYVDGLPVFRAEIIDDVIHVGAVEAIEVYRGPSQTPARFAGDEIGCGVVVIWTQRKA